MALGVAATVRGGAVATASEYKGTSRETERSVGGMAGQPRAEKVTEGGKETALDRAALGPCGAGQ